ncbi:Protein FdhE [Anaerolineae bacterium]|nr:Protein FdhE [Anaerolineae bacterium]
MSDHETLEQLKSERARHPELADTFDLHIAILEARVAVTVTVPPLLADDTGARLARGESLLRADDLALDWDAIARLYQTICAIAARHRPDDADAFAELAREMNSAHARILSRAYLANTFASLITHHTPLAAFVFNNALHPFLAAYARAWQPLVNDATWYRAHCPICGGAPDFAALEKESGARRLLCARCDSEWTFQRAVCPFCAEDAPGKLGYFASENNAKGTFSVYRLYTCENCKRYLKTIDLRELARDVNLPAERVMTIGMDVAAVEAGYQSG